VKKKGDFGLGGVKAGGRLIFWAWGCLKIWAGSLNGGTHTQEGLPSLVWEMGSGSINKKGGDGWSLCSLLSDPDSGGHG